MASKANLQRNNVLVPEGSHDGHFTLEVLHRVPPPSTPLCFIWSLSPLSFQLDLLHNLQQDGVDRREGFANSGLKSDHSKPAQNFEVVLTQWCQDGLEMNADTIW